MPLLSDSVGSLIVSYPPSSYIVSPHCLIFSRHNADRAATGWNMPGAYRKYSVVIQYSTVAAMHVSAGWMLAGWLDGKSLSLILMMYFQVVLPSIFIMYFQVM
jgi:hypothetical protein